MNNRDVKTKIYRLLGRGFPADKRAPAPADFGALLAEAKARHAAMAAKVEECSLSGSRLTEMHDAQNDWFDWCRENLTDRGIRMTVKAGTGEPRGLFVFVAGEEG
jgi:hypothetical protein